MMRTFKFAITDFKRDWHSGTLRLISISIVIAVASLTSVNFFTDRIKKAIEQQATELLAADLVLRSSNPIAKRYIQLAKNIGLQYSLYESFRSVVVTSNELVLSEVKAVDKYYPLHGKLKIADKLFAEEYETNTIPEKGTVWLDSRLIQTLKIKINDSIGLGSNQFIVKKVLIYEPDRGGDLFNIAPRLLMNRADLKKTGLIQPGSRIKYKLLLGGNSNSVKRYQNQIKINDDETLYIEDINNVRPEIRVTLERAEQFLGLAALVSIILAGLAIAMSAQHYAKKHYDKWAILRCLGLQRKQLLNICLYKLLILSLLAGLPACVIGYIAQEILNALTKGLINQSLPPPSLIPIISGIMTSLIITLAFALPQLLHLNHISPLRVLRHDLNPLPLNNYLIYSIAILALIALSPWESGNLKFTLYSLLGLFLTIIMLTFCSYLFIRLLKRLQSKLKISTRYGLGNIIRRSKQSLIQITGVGIGVTIMLLLTLVKTDLLTSWQNRLPKETPNYFIINIQPDQVNEIHSLLTNSLKKNINFYPMIRGRLIKINNTPIDTNSLKEPRAKRLVQREFNLSYTEKMQDDNQLVSGEWWSKKTRNKNVFSVEEDIAKTLGIKQGDTLTYLIAGQELDGNVINIRWVEWDSFNVNFFVIANPETLATYPATFISSFYIPNEKRDLLIKLVSEFPSITIIDVDAILSQVRTIINHVVYAVKFVFIFTLLTGIVVLFAALQSTHDERIHDSALMSALGASRKQIASALTMEFLCLGLITGLLAAFAAFIIGVILAEYIFKVDIAMSPLLWVIAPIICSVMIVAIGLYGTRRVLFSPPITILRKI